MTSNGLKKEAVKLQKILNEKYKLDVNYTSSLRILEELKNNSKSGEGSDAPTDVLPPVNIPEAPDLQLLYNNIVNNIKNIDQNITRSKEKVIYFDFNSDANKRYISSLEDEEYSTYSLSYRTLMDNFEVIKFYNLNNFINLDEKYLNILFSEVEKIFIDPLFFKVNERFFTELVHELGKEKFIGILSPTPNDGLPLIYGVVENFKNYYNEIYDDIFESYQIILTDEIMLNYKKAFANHLNCQKLKAIKNSKFIMSRKIEKINLGFTRNREQLITWDYIEHSNILVKINSEKDVDYLTHKIRKHFDHYNKTVFLRTINSLEELKNTLVLWPDHIKTVERQGGYDPRKDFIVINCDHEIMNSEELQKIVSMARSLQVNIIMAINGSLTLPINISSLTPRRILFQGEYTSGEVHDFLGKDVDGKYPISSTSIYYNGGYIVDFNKFNS